MLELSQAFRAGHLELGEPEGNSTWVGFPIKKGEDILFRHLSKNYLVVPDNGLIWYVYSDAATCNNNVASFFADISKDQKDNWTLAIWGGPKDSMVSEIPDPFLEAQLLQAYKDHPEWKG